MDEKQDDKRAPDDRLVEAMFLSFGNDRDAGYHPAAAVNGPKRVLAAFPESGQSLLDQIDALFNEAHSLSGLWGAGALDTAQAVRRLSDFLDQEHPWLSGALRTKFVNCCAYELSK